VAVQNSVRCSRLYIVICTLSTLRSITIVKTRIKVIVMKKKIMMIIIIMIIVGIHNKNRNKNLIDTLVV